MRHYFKATNVVLLLLCAMYFFTYIMRQNINTAGGVIQQEFGFSNTELGFVFSAYAYPYLLFQIVGGWFADRFGARRTLFVSGLIWAGATMLTSMAVGLFSLFSIRLLMGVGVGATLPTATRAMQHWVEPKKRGFAQGITHAFARLGNAVTPPLVAVLMAAFTWRGAFIAMGLMGVVWACAWAWYFCDDPKDHRSITAEELALRTPRPAGPRPTVPWGALVRRIWPVTLTYFCYGWILWLWLNWVPLFFKNHYHLEISKSALFASGVFLAGVVGDTAGGLLSDRIFQWTGNLRTARLGVIVLGFTGAFISLIPMLSAHDINTVALCLSSGFFFAELVIGPIWSIPMDITPAHSGTAAGIMNTGSALAAIVSPLAAGYVIDLTGNWELPFVISMVLLAIGGVTAFAMHPEIPFAES